MLANLDFLFREYPFPIGASAVVLLIVIVLVYFRVSNAPAREDVALRNRAQQLEEQKNWPAALAAFENLADNHRALANVGRQNAKRLRELLDRGKSLFAKAHDSEVAGKLPEAKNLYQEAANLHGDREQQALAAIVVLNSKLNPPEPPPVTNKRTSRVTTSGTGGKSQSARKETTKPAGEACQLIPSDVTRHLERADRARGRGEYLDAERLYKDVLACEPNNDRAITGLARTRKPRSPNESSRRLAVMREKTARRSPAKFLGRTDNTRTPRCSCARNTCRSSPRPMYVLPYDLLRSDHVRDCEDYASSIPTISRFDLVLKADTYVF